MTGKYLITTDQWFLAPNGVSYRAVWGDVQIVSDEILGIKTNSRATNWYAKVGSDENHVIVAGCQIHYAVKCNEEPNTAPALDYNADATNGIKEYTRPTSIWIAK